MVDTKAVDQPATESESHEHWTQERAEEHMREFLASLPPPLSLDDLARAQGIKPIKCIDDLPRWPEDDLDAWDGFDEFLEELRHGNGDLRPWEHGPKPDDKKCRPSLLIRMFFRMKTAAGALRYQIPLVSQSPTL